MSRNTFIASTLFAGVAALVGCNATAPPESQATPSASAAADASTSASGAAASSPAEPATPATGSIVGSLGDATYAIDVTGNGMAPLRDGVYEEPIPNSSSKASVHLGPTVAHGDLDGDGQEDATVTLLASSGGSGSFTYIAAVMNRSGVATPLPALAVGDRIAISALRIVDGAIVATWLERKADDPMTTPPSVGVEKRFVVRAGKLLPVDELPVDTAQVELRGHYTWGAEVETFQPCGSRQRFWVVGDKALLQPLRDQAAELARASGRPYQPVYIEASGISEGKATDGFAMDFEAVYRLATVRTIARVTPPGCNFGG